MYENVCRPYGTRIFFALYPALRLRLRAGLNYFAPTSTPVRAKAARTGDPGYGARFCASTSCHWRIPRFVLTRSRGSYAAVADFCCAAWFCSCATVSIGAVV